MGLSELIAHLAPTLGVIATGWFGMKASKSANLNKEQFNELKDELGTIQKSVETVKVVGEDNNRKIDEVNEKLAVHDEAHLVTMYLRLERDISTAIKRGYTTVHESDIIHKMHKSYKKLGGNGYIDALYSKYVNLEVRN
ncbi:hypothetical protein [Streptococcus parasanguinis]|uniref:hypothetical protein n=1 Tax=Streptococcus parasanguinis TaxID=1318 RepID=UPI0020C89D05|nr:hypothetical protein [Streptococcus parasanguinis]MCP8991779.1 hypothetical protein [Streptococcus parasanguinis]MCP9002869.1 hypothetical protein [Streptococcus parasanguinis]MCP9009133.1 hypothetical protein [Streptococcus parasanguinis]MCP9034814.1 hypothetical protein [Streptococcus parasanguinis]